MLFLLILHIIRKLRFRCFDSDLSRIIRQIGFKIKYVLPILLLSASDNGVKKIKTESLSFEVVNKNKSPSLISIEDKRSKPEIDKKPIINK